MGLSLPRYSSPVTQNVDDFRYYDRKLARMNS